MHAAAAALDTRMPTKAYLNFAVYIWRYGPVRDGFTKKKIVSELAGRLLSRKLEQMGDPDRTNIVRNKQGHLAGWRLPLALRS